MEHEHETDVAQPLMASSPSPQPDATPADPPPTATAAPSEAALQVDAPAEDHALLPPPPSPRPISPTSTLASPMSASSSTHLLARASLTPSPLPSGGESSDSDDDLVKQHRGAGWRARLAKSPTATSPLALVVETARGPTDGNVEHSGAGSRSGGSGSHSGGFALGRFANKRKLLIAGAALALLVVGVVGLAAGLVARKNADAAAAQATSDRGLAADAGSSTSTQGTAFVTPVATSAAVVAPPPSSASPSPSSTRSSFSSSSTTSSTTTTTTTTTTTVRSSSSSSSSTTTTTTSSSTTRTSSSSTLAPVQVAGDWNGESLGFGVVYGCVEPGLVALTFDDGPAPHTPELLDLLDQLGIKATFFINGRNSGDLSSDPFYQGILRREVDSGHCVGSHTWSHATLPGLSESAIRDEMVHLENVMQGIVGRKPNFMRPPTGAINDVVTRVMQDLGYGAIVIWNQDTGDWTHPQDVAASMKVYNDVLASSNPWNDNILILDHDIVPTVAQLVRQAVQAIREKGGWTFVTMDRCLHRPCYRY